MRASDLDQKPNKYLMMMMNAILLITLLLLLEHSLPLAILSRSKQKEKCIKESSWQFPPIPFYLPIKLDALPGQ